MSHLSSSLDACFALDVLLCAPSFSRATSASSGVVRSFRSAFRRPFCLWEKPSREQRRSLVMFALGSVLLLAEKVDSLFMPFP